MAFAGFLGTLIKAGAFGVPLRPRGFVKGHTLGIAVLLTVQALAPTRVTPSVHGSLPPFEQEVVGAVGADNKVARTVVRSDVVHVVDFFLPFEEATEGALSYKGVLGHVPLVVAVRVAGRTNENVSATLISPTLPVRVFLKAPHRTVALAKTNGFAFALNPSSAIVASGRNGGGQSATAFTKSSRVRQSCAPSACADCNITVFMRSVYV